ncbi:MAG: Maf family protein [Thermomicrobia bacterium]|nr:Maf family protein [Thermomicrobia bacterium]
MSNQPPLVLASGSPRRRALLGLLGLPFIVDPSGADETFPAEATAEEVACSLALIKAREVAARHPGTYILGADTLVTVDGRILGKPTDTADAARMLRLLRGRAHRVPTGVALIAPDGTETALVETATVTMHPYTEVAISAYLSTGESSDKAGSYAVQGAGGALVASVEGCYTTVVGFPLCRVTALLHDVGCVLPADPTVGCQPGRFCAINPRRASGQ